MIEEKMYRLATELIEKRYPKGWGGAAVIRTEKDNYFTSVAIETSNSSATLCIEVGAMCEAHKYAEAVTHCLCVVRDDECSPYKILSPCGICQERLRFWGENVLVGVTTPDFSLKFVKLKEISPFHWSSAYTNQQLKEMADDN